MRWLATRLTSSRLARLWLAALVLAAHLVAVGVQGQTLFKRPFVVAGPGPTIGADAPVDSIQHWRRLVVSAWDSGQYLVVALRGHSRCPRADTRKADYRELTQRCNVNFYPAYGLAGMLVNRVTKIPVDWALFGISVLCGLGTLYLMTSRAIVSALGATETLLALYLFAVFPSAFHLVVVLTESPMLFFAIAAFVALRRRSYLGSALLAGAGTGVHFRGTGMGIACGLAVLVSFLTDTPRGRGELARRVAAVLLCCWGGALLWAWYGYMYKDPLLYIHAAQGARYIAPGSQSATVAYNLYASLKPTYAGILILLVTLLGAFGFRATLAAFERPERVYMVVFTAFIGTALMSRGGDWIALPRYMFSLFPLFFFLARTFRGKTAALAIWTVVCLAHYWEVELCAYVGFQSMSLCSFAKY